MIDLRSDTVTEPTEAMRAAMAAAPVGDDVYGEDPTVNRLEALAAERLGKEAALFTPSGVMSNLVAVLTHCQRGDEVLVEAQAHIFYYETGSVSAVAGVIPRTITGEDGRITPEQLVGALRPPNVHFAPTALLCLENTHNRAGGTVMTAEQTRAVAEVAHAHGVRVHLDGARLFNAAVALGADASALAAPCDSVMIDLSKGLSAPVGSLLAGSGAFVERARRFRKMVGGGMRQAGVIAAAGIVALETMIARLAEDHAVARRLAERLSAVDGFAVDLRRVQSNIVQVSVEHPRLDAAATVTALRARGVLANAAGPRLIRLVTHRQVTREDTSAVADAFQTIAAAA